MNKENILVIILPFFAILVIGVAGYFYWSSKHVIPANTPTLAKNNALFPISTPSDELTPEVAKKILPLPDPTANWKTYRNDKYGFEIQYPANLQSGSCPNNLAGLSCANGAKVFIGSLSLNIVTDSDPERDKNGARLFFNGYFQGTKTKQSGFEDCFINNVKNSSAAISYVYCSNRPIFMAQIKGGGIEIYVLGSSWNGPILEGFTDQNQIDQTLSTFKFLNETKNVSVVCSDEIFGYNIGDYYECQNFNVLYPGKNVVDAPIIITDKNWKELNSCGGMPGPNGPNVCPKQYNWDKCSKKSCN